MTNTAQSEELDLEMRSPALLGSSPDLLIVGHLTRDLTPQGSRPGGTCLYATATALRLGATVRVLTSAQEDYCRASLPAIAQVHCIPSPETTTFTNLELAGSRRQRLLARASPLRIEHLPPNWDTSPLVLLAPVAQEVDPHLASRFPASLVAATAQGWMRRWDAAGRVLPCPWQDRTLILPHLDVLVLSEHDADQDWGLLSEYARGVPTMAITRGRQGCTVFHRGRRWDLPATPARQRDPTGAGDVFAAAFIIRLARGDGPLYAAAFAGAAAAFAVEAPGLQSLPTVEMILDRLQHPERYLA